jgi:hypothetical protein
MVPTRNGATLIINKRTNVWGTGYDATQDWARIPMRVEQLAQPAERLTVSFADGGPDRLVMRFDWGDRRMSVQLQTRSSVP